MTNPAAWHPDPTAAHEYRWWDGTRWTEHVADGGQASVDPLSGDPGAGTTGGTGTDADTGQSAHGGDTEASGTDADVGRSAHEGDTEASGSWQQPGSAEAAATAEQPVQQPEQTWQQPAQPADQSWQQPADPGARTGGQPPSWQESPSWSQPGQPAAAPAPAPATNGVAIAALVIGIIAILISWVPALGALAGILALVLGFVGRSKAKKTPANVGSGQALTGIVTGILATLISIGVTIALVAFGSSFMGTFETYEQCLEQGNTAEECDDELERDLLDRFGQ